MHVELRAGRCVGCGSRSGDKLQEERRWDGDVQDMRWDKHVEATHTWGGK